jgi:hypothetical protein
VIGGDFNFKSFGERLASESIQTDRSEFRALQEFRANGFSVAWRDSHPAEPLPQTLRWNGAPTTPYHCDGFLTRGFVETAITCDVVSAEFAVGYSDHNPLLLQVWSGETA